jgi:glyoxylase-like metal-dependent hydrolase (beta-lactamase superfamily II)
MAELMQDAKFRDADEFFDSEKTLDLGGVRVRLLWYGGTHTNGDTLIFVEGDRVLFAGDVLMNRRFLAFGAPRSSLRMWIQSIDNLEPLRPAHVVPSHGERGDGSLIELNRQYLKALQSRVNELKRDGKTADQVVETVTAESPQSTPTGREMRAPQHVSPTPKLHEDLFERPFDYFVFDNPRRVVIETPQFHLYTETH